jgi:hypothetical protein
MFYGEFARDDNDGEEDAWNVKERASKRAKRERLASTFKKKMLFLFLIKIPFVFEALHINIRIIYCVRSSLMSTPHIIFFHLALPFSHSLYVSTRRSTNNKSKNSITQLHYKLLSPFSHSHSCCCCCFLHHHCVCCRLIAHVLEEFIMAKNVHSSLSKDGWLDEENDEGERERE